MLYCLHRMDEVLKAGYALLLEGESDCHTAWFHGIPAIGIPGAGTWKPEWDGDVADIPKLYFVVEDAAGEKMWKKLSEREAFDGRLRRLG
jgi:putative DNA primase/helicase